RDDAPILLLGALPLLLAFGFCHLVASSPRRLLLRRLLLARHGATARPLAGAGVGLRALAPDRQPLAMPHPAVAADLHQPLDVLAHFLAQVALDPPFVRDDLADAPRLVLGELLDAGGGRHVRLGQDVLGARAADAGDVGESDTDLP